MARLERLEQRPALPAVPSDLTVRMHNIEGALLSAGIYEDRRPTKLRGDAALCQTIKDKLDRAETLRRRLNRKLPKSQRSIGILGPR